MTPMAVADDLIVLCAEHGRRFSGEKETTYRRDQQGWRHRSTVGGRGEKGETENRMYIFIYITGLDGSYRPRTRPSKEFDGERNRIEASGGT